MQKTKTLSAFILTLLLIFAALMANTSYVKAQTTSTLPSYAFIVVAPNPVGVNQQCVVDFWLSDPIATAAVSRGDRYHGFIVTITKPDGTTENKGPFDGNDLSSAYFLYIPTQLGTYTFKVNYPGETFTSFNVTYLASSATYALTVQQEPAPSAQTMPLPATYWTRPANAMNYGWGSVTSNWLMAGWNSTSRNFDQGSVFVGEGTAPKSAHILWTRPIGGAFGGLVGGTFGNTPYYSGMSYEYYFKPPVIINGVLYYNTIAAQEPRTIGDVGNLGIVAVNMRNGQTLYTIPNASLSFGQIYNYISPNQAGAYAYLWSTSGSTWKYYDATTGNLVGTLVNVPTGLTTFGPNGEIITYRLAFNTTTQSQQLTKWNSSKAQTQIPGLAFRSATNNEWTIRAFNLYGLQINATGTTSVGANVYDTNGIEWQVDAVNKAGQSFTALFGQGYMAKGNTLIAMIPTGSNQAYTNTSSTIGLEFIGYSMLTGATVFDTNITAPPGLPNDFNGIASFEYQWLYNGIFYQFEKQTMQWVAYDVTTGNLLWTSAPYENPWGMYAEAGGYVAAYGNFYAAGFDGMIHAYNTTTGQTTWEFATPSAGNINPYGVFTFYSGITILDNTIFAITGNHGNGVEPLYQNQSIVAVDATTGKLNWQMLGWFEQPAFADGVMVTHNNYDNLIYAFGKGPSATTVTAPQTSVPTGHSVTITGTVTDQSIGAKGTPAISDASISDWMAYLYEQQVKPTNAKGVDVILTAVDPNGNSQTIGTTTTDTNGNYGIMWTPPVAGLYKVIATFAGTNSYYGSDATTYLGVEVAASTPEPTVTPTPTPTATATPTPTASPSPAPNPEQGPPTDLLVIVAAAVVVIVIAAAVVLKRRK